MIALRLEETVFKEMEEIIHKRRISRNAYINEALFFYNKLSKRKFLKKQLTKESKIVRVSSLEALHEF